MSHSPKALLLLVLVAFACLSCVEGRSVLAKKKRKTGNKPASKPIVEEIVYNTDFPFACTLNVTEAETLCSGVLVDKRWVVTAAHCVDEATAPKIKLFCDGGEDPIAVETIVVDEEWLSIETLPHDIAMLKLKKPSRLPPSPLVEADTSFVNGSMFALETNNEDIAQQTLTGIAQQSVTDATYVGQEECNSTFLWTRSIDDSMLCATTEQPKCISESGSALFFTPSESKYDDNPSNVLVGIASFETRACVRYGFPVVYTSIASHLSWIKAVIAGKNSGSSKNESKSEAKLIESVTKEYSKKNKKELVAGAKEAIAVDDAVTLAVLLDLGLSPNAKVDAYGRTLLHFCAESDAYSCAQLLVDREAKLEILEKSASATPLHFAASNGSIPVAKVLLEAGAYVNAVDDYHFTPLHYVVTSETGKLTVLKFLLESGGNMHETDKEGATPIHHAAAANWVSATRVFIKNGANLVVYADDNGSPLHWAARGGANDTIIVLLEAGMLIEATPKGGLRETALSFAVRHEAPLSTIKVLVNSGGANVNVADRKGNTPLHTAARNGDPETIQFFIKAGSNSKTMNKRGKRPIDVFCLYHNCSKKKNEITIGLLRP